MIPLLVNSRSAFNHIHMQIHELSPSLSPHTPTTTPPPPPPLSLSQVFVMGQGDMGQLGLGEDIVERKKPHPVGGVLEGSEVIQVVCGGMHTVVLTKDGKVGKWRTIFLNFT